MVSVGFDASKPLSSSSAEPLPSYIDARSCAFTELSRKVLISGKLMNCVLSSLKKTKKIKWYEMLTYIVSGADMSLSDWDMLASPLNVSLCLGLLSNIYVLSSRSSLRFSLNSGIFALGITVNGEKLSWARDLTALGDVLLCKSLLSTVCDIFTYLPGVKKVLLRMLMLNV